MCSPVGEGMGQEQLVVCCMIPLMGHSRTGKAKQGGWFMGSEGGVRVDQGGGV